MRDADLFDLMDHSVKLSEYPATDMETWINAMRWCPTPPPKESPIDLILKAIARNNRADNTWPDTSTWSTGGNHNPVLD